MNLLLDITFAQRLYLICHNCHILLETFPFSLDSNKLNKFILIITSISLYSQNLNILLKYCLSSSSYMARVHTYIYRY